MRNETGMVGEEARETVIHGYSACMKMNIKKDKLPCCRIIVYNPKHKHGKYVLPLCGEEVAESG